MRCFILGATGNTGTQLVELALQHGHTVTAFVRSPQKLPQDRAGLTVVQGDPANISAMAKAMAGHDVVFSALAPRMGEMMSSKRSWTMAGHAANIVEAMKQAGVARLFAFSSAGLFPDQNILVRVLSFPVRGHMADLRAMEETYEASGLDWTVLRPTWMGAGESDAYRVSTGALPDRSKSMHYRGLAKFMIDAAATGAHRQQVLGIGR